MIPQSIGCKYNVGKVAQIQCVRNAKQLDLDIKGHCFLLLIVWEGSAYFRVRDITFEAVGPCFVCFDEREQPILIRKRKLKCDAVYFHPTFLNVNMTFERLRSKDYEPLALSHDMFLLKPFTDLERYVIPLFEKYMYTLNTLSSSLENELKEQRDWYWSCRSRSFFMEMILLLERCYGTTEEKELNTTTGKIKNPHLKNAVMFIESHYQENVSLERIAKAASINHSTLTQLFKDELEVTPVEYVWQYRITVAKKHLEFISLPVKDIAIRCGFKTVQHFCRKFEAYIGSTPTIYRDMKVKARKAAFSKSNV